jgi:hypothetical protein
MHFRFGTMCESCELRVVVTRSEVPNLNLRVDRFV